MALTSNYAVQVGASLSQALDLTTATAPLTKAYQAAFTSGVLAGQADRVFSDTRTLTASANEDLDLAGVLIDALGAVCTFARVKALIVAADKANTNDVLVGGAATNGFFTWSGGATHQVRVRPGGVFAHFAGAADLTGYTVTAATGDLLRVTNSAGVSSVNYDIIIIGASA